MRTIHGKPIAEAHHVETHDGWTVRVARGGSGTWQLMRVYDAGTCICDTCHAARRLAG